jgi:hypothetical protein
MPRFAFIVSFINAAVQLGHSLCFVHHSILDKNLKTDTDHTDPSGTDCHRNECRRCYASSGKALGDG